MGTSFDPLGHIKIAVSDYAGRAEVFTKLFSESWGMNKWMTEKMARAGKLQKALAYGFRKPKLQSQNMCMVRPGFTTFA